jgi:hypothetical protein
MAVSQKLVTFVVDLVVDPEKRGRFHSGDAATREQMMSDAELNAEEKTAIRDSDSDALTKLLVIEIIIPTIKRAPVRKPAKPAKMPPKPRKPPKKKAPKRGGRAKGRKAAKR